MLSKNDIENIINLYTNSNIGIEKICSEYKIGKLKVKKLLADNNTPLKKKGAQITHDKTNVIINTKTIT